MERLKNILQKLIGMVSVIKENKTTDKGTTIYQRAVSLLGVDASPNDLAPDELGCAETVSNVAGIQPIIISTSALYDYLAKSLDWVEVTLPIPGDILISPTGMGGKNGITHGHTGIVGRQGIVMSNNSYTGKFEANYTIATWTARYKTKGGYPIYYFRNV